MPAEIHAHTHTHSPSPSLSHTYTHTQSHSTTYMYVRIDIIATSSEKEAFSDIDVALLVGSMPRREGMLRKDLLTANAKIFCSQGKSLDQYAKKTVKVQIYPL